MPKKLLTVGDVALAFGVSPRTVRNWADDGLIPIATRTLAGHRRFDPDEIEQMRKEASR